MPRSMTLAVLALMVVSSSAMAETYLDDATGLALTPPDQFVVTRAPPAPPHTVRLVVADRSGGQGSCQVAFEPLPANETMTQDAVNAVTATPQWQERARMAVASFATVSTLDSYSQDGIVGLIAVLDPSGTANLDPAVGGQRHLLAVLETPKGRTTTICSAKSEEFDQRRPVFEAIIRGVKPPHP